MPNKNFSNELQTSMAALCAICTFIWLSKCFCINLFFPAISSIKVYWEKPASFNILFLSLYNAVLSDFGTDSICFIKFLYALVRWSFLSFLNSMDISWFFRCSIILNLFSIICSCQGSVRRGKVSTHLLLSSFCFVGIYILLPKINIKIYLDYIIYRQYFQALS